MDGSYAPDLDHTLHVLRSRPPADFGSFPGRLGFSRRGLRKNMVSKKSYFCWKIRLFPVPHQYPSVQCSADSRTQIICVARTLPRLVKTKRFCGANYYWCGTGERHISKTITFFRKPCFFVNPFGRSQGGPGSSQNLREA